MAKRFDDEEENDAPVERPRRRPRKKPVADEDDDSGGPKGQNAPEDGEEEENSLSTGNVFLDIVLDFRDDCIDWARANFAKALALGVVVLVLGIAFFGLTVRYFVNYLNRPTLKTAVAAYDYGSYAEARLFAESVLKYAAEDDYATRSEALFVLGASTCAIAEIAWDSNRQPYYLAAANYLGDAERLGFRPHQRAEGFFLLGKSLYLSGELARCRPALQSALEYGAENTKMIYWYSANSFFLEPNPDLSEALRNVRLFQRDPHVTEDERYEADLLESMILLQNGETDAAEKAFLRVPRFDRFITMRTFVSGQIAFYRAREYTRQAIELETDPDPRSFQDIPIAPPPVSPESGEQEGPNTIKSDPEKPASLSEPREIIVIPSDEKPIAPAPIETPIAPFENPETEKLLPGHPDSSAWPVFPKSPNPTFPAPEANAETEAKSETESWTWSVVSPSPVPEDEIETEEIRTEPLFRRMNGWVESPFAPVAADANAESEEKKISPDPDPDPDAVLVLPTEPSSEPSEKSTAPVPPKLPEQRGEAAPSDPKLHRAELFRKSASDKYREAIRAFQFVRQRDSFVPRWLRTAGLLEGICHEESGDIQNADKMFLSLSTAYPGTSEAAAADFFWAELQRRLGHPDVAQGGYVRTFDFLRNEPNYVCPWLPKEAILERMQDNIRDHLTMKEFRQALTMVHIARDVMPGADAALNLGETYELWAQTLSDGAAVVLGSEGENLAREAREKYRRAGEAFEEYARYRFDSEEYDQQIWRSAEDYRLGRDFRRSIPLFRQFLRINWNQRQVETLFYIGEMSLHLDDLDGAVEFLKRALDEYPNHSLVPRIRITLAKAYFEQKNWDKARQTLQLNLIGQHAPSSAVYRDSMYALGKLLYERNDLVEAIPFLEDILKVHPEAVQAADAHYCLSQAYLAKADEIFKSADETPLENVRQQIRAGAVEFQERALQHIRQAEEMLVKRETAIGLSDSERLMMRNALFGEGSILMKLGRYEPAILTFDIAATRYQDRPEAMDALMQIAVAYRLLGRPEDAMPVLNRAEVLLNDLTKSGTIPSQNNWAAQIQTQKNLLQMGDGIPRESSTP